MGISISGVTGSAFQRFSRRRQCSDFVGREEQITLFRRNLALPPDDDRRRFIFDASDWV